MILYKYTSWQPFNEIGELIRQYYVKENLLNNTIYYNSPDNLNDPYELTPVFKVDYDAKQLLEKTTNVVMRHEGITSLVLARRRAMEIIKRQKLQTATGKEKAIERGRTVFKQSGICCFTTNPPSTILMWSHYGGNHTGLCMTFDFPNTNILNQPPPNCIISNPMKVAYDSRRSVLDVISLSLDEIQRCLITKSEEWSYENEYRTTCTKPGVTVRYHPTHLIQIIAGCKMPDREFRELKDTISKMEIKPKLLKAIRHEENFELCLQEVF